MTTFSKTVNFLFDKLFKIWKDCYIHNPSERAKLNELDELITKRGTLISRNLLFVQLTQSEINYLKDLYEAVI